MALRPNTPIVEKNNFKPTKPNINNELIQLYSNLFIFEK